jgi:chromosome segregation ATPase
MAPTGKARTGWQHQAERLAGAHATLGTKAMAVAEQARRRRLVSIEAQSIHAHETRAATAEREVELAGELDMARAKIGGLERRVAHEAASTRALSEQMQLLASQSEAAEKRIGDLERDLEAARAGLTRKDTGLAQKDDENRSLRAALEQTRGENARLSGRLAERDAAFAEALAKHEFLQSALAAAEAECRRLTDDLIDACERRRSETGALGAQLEAMSDRAAAAEKLLAEARECLMRHVAEHTAAAGRLADASAARGAAERKIQQLEDALASEQDRVDELERSRLELIAATNTLLKTFRHRDAAFQNAAQKIEGLNRQIAELQAEARRGQRRQATDGAGLEFSDRRTARDRSDDAGAEARRKWAELAGELGRLVKHREHAPALLLAAS